jgi:hypothetical protein
MRRDDEGRSDDDLVDRTAGPSSDGLNSTNEEAPPIRLLVRVGDNLPRVTPSGYTVAIPHVHALWPVAVGVIHGGSTHHPDEGHVGTCDPAPLRSQFLDVPR